MKPQRYWAILANFITFNLIPFAVVPYWLLFIKREFFRREWAYLLLLTLLSLWVLVFDPAPANIKMVSNLAEIIILSVYFFSGHSLFEQATEKRLLWLAGCIAFLTWLDFYILNLSITRFVAHAPTAEFINKTQRGPFVLGMEASYWALALLGFYTYSLGRCWWQSALAFATLIFWNGGIYTLSLLVICSLFLFPWQARLVSVLFVMTGFVSAVWLQILPKRLLQLINRFKDGAFGYDHVIDIVLRIEKEFGSRRYSSVIRSFDWANMFTYSPHETYSLLAQMALQYGWLIALFVWVFLLGLTMARYVMPLGHKLLLVVLTVIAGPVSIPFMYSFVFACAQRNALPPSLPSQTMP
ncbi:MAG: hypothetical protein ORN28_11080 [Rhodoferax sp.]|nr:hypothetical protein [Rhodoferax sp.]